MIFLIKSKKKKELIMLSLIYLLSQGMLIIVSGRWWDDWCFYKQTFNSLKDMAMQLGRPTLIPIIKMAQSLPEAGYRVITFLMFYFCMLFTYKVLKVWLKINDEACFWICALYSIIPTNDARIVLAVFPYTIGLFFFMVGFSYLAGKMNEVEFGYKERCVSCLFFLFSFVLNSNIFFYTLILVLILSKEKNIRKCIKYIEFLLLPIVFFLLKNMLFPPHGGYENYNKITLSKMLFAIKNIIIADYNMIKNLLLNWLGIDKSTLIVIVLLALIIVFRKKFYVIKNVFMLMTKRGDIKHIEMEKQKKIEERTRTEQVKLIMFGLLSLSVGLFPYVVIRNSSNLSTVSVGSRDTILTTLGAAILIYSIVVLVFKKKFQEIVFSIFIMCGILFFNTQYISYQQDYYRQLGFQYQLSQEKNLADTKNIVYLNSDPGRINIQSLYVLNGNAAEVYHKQNKCIINSFQEVSDLGSEMLEYYAKSGLYHMMDYDIGYTRVDAIILYSMDITLKDTLKMKLYEILKSNKFDDWIVNRSTMQVYWNGTEEYDRFIVENGYSSVK